MNPAATDHAQQLGLDVLSLAKRSGMPQDAWSRDSRVRRACHVLGIDEAAAWALPVDAYKTGLAAATPAAPVEPKPEPKRVDVGLEIWTDGACSGNPGPGGWGWITNEDGPGARRGNGGDGATTNNRMEMLAVIEALGFVPERPVVVVTDSKYVYDAITKTWHIGWARKGWKTAQGKPVANQDLWERLVPLATGPGVAFRWVKGHAGYALNEAADALAVEARDAAGRARRR